MDRSKRRRQSHKDRMMMRIEAAYRKAKGIPTGPINLDDVFDFAEAEGLYELEEQSKRRRFKAEFKDALSHQVITDDDGQPIRKYHPVPVLDEKTQQVLFSGEWQPQSDFSNGEWRLKNQLERRQVRGVVLQKARENRHYNKHHNPGDPVEDDWDFNKDVAESLLPLEYPDSPPESSSDDQG